MSNRLNSYNGQPLPGLTNSNIELDSKRLSDSSDNSDVISHSYAPTKCDAIVKENARIDVINGDGKKVNGTNGANGTQLHGEHDLDNDHSHLLFEKKSNRLNQYYNQLNTMNGYGSHTNGTPILNQKSSNTKNNNSFSSQNANNNNSCVDLNGAKQDAYKNANGINGVNGGNGVNGISCDNGITNGHNGVNTKGNGVNSTNGVSNLSGHNQIGLPCSSPPPPPQRNVAPPPPPNSNGNGNSRKSYIITNGNGALLTNGNGPPLLTNGKSIEETVLIDGRKGRCALCAFLIACFP